MFYVAALPRFIYCGDDAIEKIREIEGKRVFVVTDRIMVELGFLNRVLEQLKDREVEVFSEVEPEPSIDIALKAVEKARSFKPDLIVALGGGSCIDVAKTVWVPTKTPA